MATVAITLPAAEWINIGGSSQHSFRGWFSVPTSATNRIPASLMRGSAAGFAYDVSGNAISDTTSTFVLEVRTLTGSSAARLSSTMESDGQVTIAFGTESFDLDLSDATFGSDGYSWTGTTANAIGLALNDAGSSRVASGALTLDDAPSRVETAPPKVTGIAVTVGDGTAAITWDAATDANSYAVNISDDGGSTWTSHTSTTTSYNAAGLTNGTEHSVRVRGINTDANPDLEGPWSDISTFTPAAAVQLPVAVAPSVTIDAVATGDEGDIVSLTATVTGGTYDGALTYAWTVEGGTTGLSDATAASPTWTRPSVNADTDYTIGLTVSVAGTGTVARNGTSDSTTATTVEATVRNVATDTTPPTLVSSELNAAGNLLTMQFSESINNVPNQTAFDILDDGTRKSGTNHRINPTDDTQFLVDFTFAIADGSVVTLEYTKPNTNPIEDDAGNDLANFGPVNVATNWPTALPRPEAGTVTITGATTATVGDTVTLTAVPAGTRRGTLSYAWTGAQITAGSDKTSLSVDVERSSAGNANVTFTTTATGDGTTVASGTDTARDTHRVVFSAVPVTTRTDTIYISAATQPDKPTGGQSNEHFLPPGAWTDDPVGVTNVWPFEWVSSRKKSPGAASWGKFSGPGLFAKFSEAGAGIQTVYQRTQNPTAPNSITTTDEQDTDNEHTPTGWSGSPVQINDEYPYAWIAERVRDQGADKWGKFSAPQLWAQVPGVGPTVYSGQSKPPLLIGGEGDTWAELNDSGNIIGVWTKYQGAWLRLSGNPDNSQWSKGNGTPTSNASSGTWYGDETNANIWVRGTGRWHWVADMDQTGQIKWRFGPGVPSNSLGSNTERYLRWTNAVWYEKQGGSWVVMDDLSGLPVFQVPDTEGGAAVRQIIKNTGSTASNVSGTDDIRIELGDGGFVTLDTTDVGEFVTSDTYPADSFGREGTTFALTQRATSNESQIVEVWHKVGPASWSQAGNHPAFAEWFTSVGPPADFNFADGVDQDGTYWLESGPGRVWSRIEGIWYWIFDLSSGGKHQVYGGIGDPPNSLGEVGDRWLDIGPDASSRPTLVSLRLHDRGSAGWAPSKRFFGTAAEKSPKAISGWREITGPSTISSSNQDIVIEIYPDTNPRFPTPSTYTILISSRPSFRGVGVLVDGYTNRYRFTLRSFSGDNLFSIVPSYTPGLTPVSGPATVIYRDVGGVITAVNSENTTPGRYSNPTGGTRPPPTSLSLVSPIDENRYIEVDWTEPAGGAVDSSNNSLLLVGYEGQVKKRSDSWPDQVIRVAADIQRPIRTGPNDSGTLHDVRVRAVYSDHGRSSWASGSVTTGGTRQPGSEQSGGNAPTSMTATAVTSMPRYIDLNWTPPSGSPTGYEGQIKQTSDDWASAETLFAPSNISRPVRVGPQEYTTEYDFRIRAVYSNGDRSEWISASATTGEDPETGTKPPSIAWGLYPRQRDLSASSDGLFLVVNWVPPQSGYSRLSGETKGKQRQLASYEGQIKTSSQAWSQAVSYSAPANVSRPVRVGPGAASTAYDIRLRAVYSDGGVSDWSMVRKTTGAA